MTDDDHATQRAQYGPFWMQTIEDSNKPLMSYARRLANGRIYDAEDLVQETACRALIYSRNPGEIRNPRSYLLRMMRNIWIDKWAKENTANVESLEDLLSTGRHPIVEPVVQRLLESEELRAKMAAKQGPLTPREKLLMQLYLNGYKCKEIADKLHEDVRVTRSDLNAVKAKIRYRVTKGKAKPARTGES